MANVKVMWKLFDFADQLIREMSHADPGKAEILEHFLIRLLTFFDGLESPKDDGLNWNGIALVARDDIPDGVEEINDGFLHDMWSERQHNRKG